MAREAPRGSPGSFPIRRSARAGFQSLPRFVSKIFATPGGLEGALESGILNGVSVPRGPRRRGDDGAQGRGVADAVPALRPSLPAGKWPPLRFRLPARARSGAARGCAPAAQDSPFSRQETVTAQNLAGPVNSPASPANGFASNHSRGGERCPMRTVAGACASAVRGPGRPRQPVQAETRLVSGQTPSRLSAGLYPGLSRHQKLSEERSRCTFMKISETYGA